MASFGISPDYGTADPADLSSLGLGSIPGDTSGGAGGGGGGFFDSLGNWVSGLGNLAEQGYQTYQNVTRTNPYGTGTALPPSAGYPVTTYQNPGLVPAASSNSNLLEYVAIGLLLLVLLLRKGN